MATGCGGAKSAPPKAAPPGPSALAKEPVEKADLSPVPAPPDLFVVGRVRRPGALAETLGRWAGLPFSLKSVLAREVPALDGVVVWDAPVELAVALPGGGRRNSVRTIVSIGVSSLSAALSAARDRGLSPERVMPEVFALSIPGGVRCLVGPSLGSVSARLVCGERAADVEALFPYATRGLPNENFGTRELELELRVDPIRRRYASEIAGARLLAGFLLRQAELDAPRFDRALADVVYAVADDLVLGVEDADSVKLGATLDEAGQELLLELTWKLRSTRSWIGSLSEELSRRAAPPPAAFARLPADATGAAFAVDSRTSKTTAVQAPLLELADAYLEHERVGKAARERVRVLLTDFWKQVGASYVQATGRPAAGEQVGWSVTRAEVASAEFERLFREFDAVIRDRELWKVLATRAELDPKVPPKSRFVLLRGKGVPAGTLALVVTAPPAIAEQVGKKVGSRSSVDAKKKPWELVIAVCPDGPGASLVVSSWDQKDAAERIAAYFADGGRRLGDRHELAALRSTRALYGGFLTLESLLDAEVTPSPGSPEPPNRGETPIAWSATATAGPPVVLSMSLNVPSEALADLPGVVASILSSL
jgi:hypothetical protein